MVGGISISFAVSSKRTNLKHNNRTMNEQEMEKNPHIDWSRTEQNYYIVQKDIRQVYEEQFADAQAEYNAKQKRSDRKIKNYYDHIKKSKKTKTQHEMIVQIGDKDTYRTEKGRQAGVYMLSNWLAGFQQRNPQLIVYNAVIHMDEATPHMHLNFVPVATGYKKGLQKQVSFDKALLQQDKTLDKARPFNDWREKEVQELEKELNKLGRQRKLVGTKEYKDVNDYKRKKDLEKEIEVLEQNAQNLQENLSNLSGKQKKVLDSLSSLKSLETQKKGQIQDLEKEKQDKLASLATLESQKALLQQDLTKKQEEQAFLAQNARIVKEKLADLTKQEFDKLASLATLDRLESQKTEEIQRLAEEAEEKKQERQKEMKFVAGNKHFQHEVSVYTKNAEEKKYKGEPVIVLPKSDWNAVITIAKSAYSERTERILLQESNALTEKFWQIEKDNNKQLEQEKNNLWKMLQEQKAFLVAHDMWEKCRAWIEEKRKAKEQEKEKQRLIEEQRKKPQTDLSNKDSKRMSSAEWDKEIARLREQKQQQRKNNPTRKNRGFDR